MTTDYLNYKGSSLYVTGEHISPEPENGIDAGFTVDKIEYEGQDVTDLLDNITDGNIWDELETLYIENL